ncbi:MAG: sulfurtransferase-like selenium metabolism protein YedF [Lachnospiraceae bacterium]|nr:sulfurtransferase-like selenium metabolism protein YedF [Lachnospiraceae bacterium]
MIKINALGDACPIPVVKTKKALDELQGAERVEKQVEVLVDNEIAVENLLKLAKSRGCEAVSRQMKEKEYKVVFNVGDSIGQPVTGADTDKLRNPAAEIGRDTGAKADDTVIVISSSEMGTGDEVLGKLLMKGFIYALTQLDALPKTMLFYNSGAFLTCEGSDSLEDIRFLEAQGTEILTCGTCLNHYKLSEKLAAGTVTNMYVIAETMAKAGKIVKP